MRQMPYMLYPAHGQVAQPAIALQPVPSEHVLRGNPVPRRHTASSVW